jgi:hypothetical protein
MSSPSVCLLARRALLPVVLASALLASELVVPIPAIRAADTEWIVPVPGRVVAPFREPISRYAAGHRGVDFAAAPGTPVKAANDGHVTFAGTVAGALHVVVGHENGIRTSYSYLASVVVSSGQRVQRGQVVGTAGGIGEAHGAGVTHFGVRIGDRYVDPMLLFRPPDLTEMVRLVPPPERATAGRSTAAQERRQLERESDDDEGDCAGGIPLIEQACDVGEDVAGVAVDGARGVGDAAVAVGEGVEWVGSEAQRHFEAGLEFAIDVGGDVGRWIESHIDEIRAAAVALVEGVDLIESVGQTIVKVAEALIELGERVYEHLFACPQPDSRSAADQPTTDNLAIAVGGFDSSLRRRADGSITSGFEPRWREFGYGADQVSYFSYGRGETYQASETHGDLHQEARDLGEQIKARAAAEPGRAVDLFGHSQGGVVVALFLQEVYRGHEDEYPPIENVVTYASPLQGTPTANLGTSAEHTLAPDLIPGGLESFHLDSTALEQLCEGSPTIDGLWRRPPPKSVRFLSIAGMEDLVVPSPSTEVPGGATEIIVQVGDPLGLDDHSGIVKDDDAISATQAHLRGETVGGCGVLAGSIGDGYAAVVRATTAAADALAVESDIDLPDPGRPEGEVP